MKKEVLFLPGSPYETNYLKTFHSTLFSTLPFCFFSPPFFSVAAYIELKYNNEDPGKVREGSKTKVKPPTLPHIWAASHGVACL